MGVVVGDRELGQTLGVQDFPGSDVAETPVAFRLPRDPPRNVSEPGSVMHDEGAQQRGWFGARADSVELRAFPFLDDLFGQ